MLFMGYKQSQGGHTLFVKHLGSGKLTTLLVYVDNIIVIGNNTKRRECLVKEFEIKDLGKLKYFLGIEVAHYRHRIFISQQKYVLDLLKEISKLGCKPVETPIK